MKKISMLIAVAVTCVSSMQAAFFLTGEKGNLVWYASCQRILNSPEEFDSSSDRFFRTYEACFEASTFPGLHEYHEDRVNEVARELVENYEQLSVSDHAQLLPLVNRHLLCSCARYCKIATNSICTENEKKLQEFLNSVNGKTN
jgi:hypothetical protein